MTLPTHIFSPGNLGLPYAQEIHRYMTRRGLLIREHDVEIGPETYKRFEDYVEKQPGRIHTLPYLIRAIGIKGQPLVWVHRLLKGKTLDQVTGKARQKIVNYLPGNPKPVKIVLMTGEWVQGGEPETDYFPLGYCWMPRRIWDLVFQQVATVDWTMLDTRLSQACINIGEKALVHWDCAASHQNV